jgi:uncharacterized C2H2 Zn-finger protein
MLYICEICNYKTGNKNNLTRHQSSKRHLENVCEQTTDKLPDPIRSGSEPKSGSNPDQNCAKCGEKFSTKSNLTRHIKRRHTLVISDHRHGPYPLVKCDTGDQKLAETRRNSQKLTETHRSGSDPLGNFDKFQGFIEPVESKDGEIILRCAHCGLRSKNNNMLRHIKNCAVKLSHDEVVKADMAMKRIEKLESDNMELKSLLQTNAVTTKRAVSALSYVIAEYKSTPALEALSTPQIDAIVYKDETENTAIEEALIFHYNHKDMAIYIGDGILEIYKKENPDEQPIWSSDCNRLTYIIREVVGDDTQWIVDKKGIKIGQKIILPLLKKIHTTMMYYLKSDDIHRVTRMGEYSKKLSAIFGIMNAVETKQLERDISTYISPYLQLSHQNKNNLPYN